MREPFREIKLVELDRTTERIVDVLGLLEDRQVLFSTLLSGLSCCTRAHSTHVYTLQGAAEK